jgi:hypothetical protein
LSNPGHMGVHHMGVHHMGVHHMGVHRVPLGRPRARPPARHPGLLLCQGPACCRPGTPAQLWPNTSLEAAWQWARFAWARFAGTWAAQWVSRTPWACWPAGLKLRPQGEMTSCGLVCIWVHIHSGHSRSVLACLIALGLCLLPSCPCNTHVHLT